MDYAYELRFEDGFDAFRVEVGEGDRGEDAARRGIGPSLVRQAATNSVVRSWRDAARLGVPVTSRRTYAFHRCLPRCSTTHCHVARTV